MSTIATFPAALSAILVEPGGDGRTRHVQVIAVAVVGDGEASTVHYLVVEADGRARLVAIDGVKLVDDSVLPPKYA